LRFVFPPFTLGMYTLQSCERFVVLADTAVHVVFYPLRIGPELCFAIQVAGVVNALGFAAVCFCCPAMFPGFPKLQLCRSFGALHALEAFWGVASPPLRMGATCASCAFVRGGAAHVQHFVFLWFARIAPTTPRFVSFGLCAGLQRFTYGVFVRRCCGHGLRGAAPGVRFVLALLFAGYLPRCGSLQNVLSESNRRIPAKCV